MTVIAASTRFRMMAADTLITDGDHRMGHAVKILEAPNGDLIGAAGSSAKCCLFMNWAKRTKRGKPPAAAFDGDDGVTGLILTTDGKLLIFESPEPDEYLDEYKAIGSGAVYAQAALSMGATPKKAVEVAIKHSIVCGGQITVLKLAQS